MTNLELIKAACFRANPNAQPQEDYKCGGCGECEACYHYNQYERVFRLADIFAALISAPEDLMQRDGLQENIIEIIAMWNLKADDLSQQSEDTINFLAGLLK